MPLKGRNTVTCSLCQAEEYLEYRTTPALRRFSAANYFKV